MKQGIPFLLSVAFLFASAMMSGKSLTSGPFAVSNISSTAASSCSASDASVTLTIDPSQQGTSPYDVSFDNGATWQANNLTPNGSGQIVVGGVLWGTYALAVRDALGDVIYPGYAQVVGCSLDVGVTENPTFSTGAVSGATGYTWTTTAGSITAGQNTTSATFDFSSLAINTTGTICAQPTGPTCTAPATCFDFRVVAISPACTMGVDTDNDGVSDICDLDDDNDGIPDLEESRCNISSIVSMGTWDNNLTPFEAGTIWNPALIASIENEVFGSGISVTEAYTTLSISGIDQPNYTGAVAANDYIEFAFTTQPNINSLFLRSFFYTKNTSAGANEYGYSIALAYSDNGFSTSQLVVSNYTIDTYVTGSQQDIRTLVDDNFASISENTTYTFRLYFFNKTTPGPARFDDFALESGECYGLLDLDGDGISNHLDLDSDNDGIYDAYEAGHGESVASNGRINGAASGSGVNGLFDGVETSVDNGVRNYSMRDSESSNDGIYDAYELDSDGDGCVDAAEEGVTDTDSDGIAGASPVSVNASGLVVGVTYAAPANNTLQNHSVSTCPTLTGRVFEDVNYGGGAGRTYAAANSSAQSSGWSNGAIAIENVRVELYSSTGAFVAAENTAANGTYSFETLAPGNYQVRFVTRSIQSNRGSNGTGDTPYGVPTFRSVGSTTFTNEVGGVDPAKEDALANTTNQNLAALTTGSTVAQSVSTISGVSGDVSNIDLGVSFNVVTNTNDAGIGSLRQFIFNSNELDNANLDLEDAPSGRPSLAKPAGADVSIFEIPGTGPHTVALTSELPIVEDAYTHVSGYTQQGSVQGPIRTRTIQVGIDANSSSRDVFDIDESNVTISGVAIYGCSRGIDVRSSGISNVHVWGTTVGLEEDGLEKGQPYIGYGIYLQNHTGGIIGTDGDGVNDLNEGNIISNCYDALVVRVSSGTLIAGNYIGVDRTGLANAGSRYRGIYVIDCPSRNVIGLDDNISTMTLEAARNVSSGNGNDGIRVSSGSNQVIAGNYLGTDYLGTSAVPNGGYGVHYLGTVNSNQLGTDGDNSRDAEERNVISGNGSGMRFIGSATGSNNWIAGNYFGVTAAGNVALPNQNHGVVLAGNVSNTIVGTNADGVNDLLERNIISGNGDDGIRIDGDDGARVAGNYIGVGADGVTSIPNQDRGIIIATTTSGCIIGYSPSYAIATPSVVGNVIRGNDDAGVVLSGSGTNNRISRNNFGFHQNLAIDIDYDGVTVNDDGDGDSGPNNWLNYPVISYAKVSGSTLRVKGFAPAGANIEFYIADAGPTPGPSLPTGFTSSFGEGFMYLVDASEGGASDNDASTGTYTDDGSGATNVKTERKFSFDIPLSSLNAAINIGDKLTAISIDATGNTSEFGGVVLARFVEICNDLIDNDGDGLVDCEDDDCPGVGVVETVAN